jgi:hypothetical protein
MLLPFDVELAMPNSPQLELNIGVPIYTKVAGVAAQKVSSIFEISFTGAVKSPA